MNLPALLFGLVVAFLAGALFHALRGGGGWHLLLHLVSSAFGFALGQAAGMWFGIALYRVGILDLGLGIFGSLVFLLAVAWLVRR